MIPAFLCSSLSRSNRSIFAILVIIYAFFVGSGAALAAQANLAWNANPQPEVAGYMLHYGQVSSAYTNKVDVGKVTTYTIAGLLDGKTYYYAVTAYDAGRAESPFSNEASATTPFAVPVAAFSADKTSGAAPATIVFTSSSTGTISSYSWNFGDGTSSTAQSPTHTYSAVGTYSVSLTTTGPGGSNTATKSSYISVTSTPPPPSPTAPTANFTPSATSGVAPLTVTFTNTSTGTISAYSWNFGDGTTSTVASPSHAYSNAGTYTVSLTVTGSGGSNTMTKSNLLTVSSAPPPGAKPNEIMVDNLGPGIQDATRTITGKWCNSVGTGYYGTTSLYNCGTSKDRYRWSFSTPTTGDYSVYVRWSTAPNRSTAVPYTVATNTGLVTKDFNQKLNGGQWMLHGTYKFTAGVTKYVELSAAKGIACADAIRIVPASAVSTNSSLVAAYGFNEGTGTRASDSSGKGNNGVVSGATWATAGRFGKALSFNGVNSWVTVNDSTSLDLTTSMTLEAWVYPTAAQLGWANVIMKEQSGASVYYLASNSDSNVPAGGVYVGGAERSLLGKSALPINTWTHVATTYDGATQKFYMNGVLVSSRTQTGAIQTSTGALRIGGNSIWGEYFKGLIDDVRIYSRAMTNSEIQADMLAPASN